MLAGSPTNFKMPYAEKIAPFKIDAIHAFTSTDENGVEGIIGMCNHLGEWTPFICADRARLDSLRPMAQKIASMSGRHVKLARFSVREDVEEIQP